MQNGPTMGRFEAFIVLIVLGMLAVIAVMHNRRSVPAQVAKAAPGDAPPVVKVPPYSTVVEAVLEGDMDLLAAHLRLGADVNGADSPRAVTPLQAAMRGRLAAARMLLDAGADPGRSSALNEHPPLSLAAVHGHHDVARLLLSRGVLPRKEDKAEADSEAWLARLARERETLEQHRAKARQEERARLDATRTPEQRLASAAEADDLPAIDALHESGMLKNTWKQSSGAALIAAVQAVNLRATRRLLELNADVTATNRDGATPLHVICSRGGFINEADVLAIMEMLIDAGASVEAVMKSYGYRPIHSAQFYPKRIKLLCERGANIDATDANGATVLHHAAYADRAAVVWLLLELGANPMVPNRSGSRPSLVATDFKPDTDSLRLLLAAETLHHEVQMAVRTGKANDLARLLDAHPQLLRSKSNGGATLMHTAAGQGHAAVVKLLIERGANLNAANDILWTPMHAAAYSQRYNTASLLVKAGAQLNGIDKNGKTPLDWAYSQRPSNRNAELIRLLTEAGATERTQDFWFLAQAGFLESKVR